MKNVFKQAIIYCFIFELGYASSEFFSNGEPRIVSIKGFNQHADLDNWISDLIKFRKRSKSA